MKKLPKVNQCKRCEAGYIFRTTVGLFMLTPALNGDEKQIGFDLWINDQTSPNEYGTECEFNLKWSWCDRYQQKWYAMARAKFERKN